MELDQQQRAAVETFSTKALVLSGAGSGKTRVITERVAHLIEDRQVSSYEILQFSFTRLASNEMKTRLESRIGSKAQSMSIGTMHGLALGYLRRFGDAIGYKPKNITVYSEWESNFLLKEVAKDLGIFKKTWKIPRKEIVKVFNDYYDKGIVPEESDRCFHIFNVFSHRVRENMSMTYGGLLVGMRLLIPTLKKHLHIKHILVDECQDLSKKQWDIVNDMVDAFGASLFIVGDDSQSLYSFRGAIPEYLIEHQSEFEIFKIENNYRSLPQIVNAANRLIKHNTDRLPLSMRATRQR